MGGPEVLHHPKDPYRVPKASEYTEIIAPELVVLQNRLAKHGLKDPWIRNHIWKYDPRYGTKFTRFLKAFGCGIPTGLVLFAITLSVETALGVDYHPWHHEHAAGHEHNKH